MANYVSFSLYGTDPKYLNGAVKNAHLARNLFPNWKIIFYVGDSIPSHLVGQLKDLGSFIQAVPGIENPASMLWRYRAVHLKDAEHVIFRDADSRLSNREAELVSIWLESGKDLHIIRDHPNHTSAILGGLWGCDAKSLRAYLPADLGDLTVGEVKYGLDQEFIRLRVYRALKLSRLIHDPIFVREFASIAPPKHPSTGEFLGEVFSSEDVPDPKGRQEVQKYWASRRRRLIVQFRGFRTMAFDFVLDLLREYSARRRPTRSN